MNTLDATQVGNTFNFLPDHLKGQTVEPMAFIDMDTDALHV